MLGTRFEEVECPLGKNHSGREVGWANGWSGVGSAGDNEAGEGSGGGGGGGRKNHEAR